MQSNENSIFYNLLLSLESKPSLTYIDTLFIEGLDIFLTPVKNNFLYLPTTLIKNIKLSITKKKRIRNVQSVGVQPHFPVTMKKSRELTEILGIKIINAIVDIMPRCIFKKIRVKMEPVLIVDNLPDIPELNSSLVMEKLRNLRFECNYLVNPGGYFKLLTNVKGPYVRLVGLNPNCYTENYNINSIVKMEESPCKILSYNMEIDYNSLTVFEKKIISQLYLVHKNDYLVLRMSIEPINFSWYEILTRIRQLKKRNNLSISYSGILPPIQVGNHSPFFFNDLKLQNFSWNQRQKFLDQGIVKWLDPIYKVTNISSTLENTIVKCYLDWLCFYPEQSPHKLALDENYIDLVETTNFLVSIVCFCLGRSLTKTSIHKTVKIDEKFWDIIYKILKNKQSFVPLLKNLINSNKNLNKIIRNGYDISQIDLTEYTEEYNKNESFYIKQPCNNMNCGSHEYESYEECFLFEDF